MSSSMRFAGAAAIVGLGCMLAGAAEAQPTETLAPATNHPSGTVKVSGTGFGAYEGVDIFFDLTDEQLAIANGSGSFGPVQITVPAAALPGTHYITALGRRTGNGAQQAFTVFTAWPQVGEGMHKQSVNPYENVLSEGTVGGLDELWTVTAADSFFASPVIADGSVFAATEAGTVYAVNANTGTTSWSQALGSGGIFGSPAVAGSTVFVGTVDGSVVALNNNAHGAVLWQTNTGAEINAPLAVANGVVYVGNFGGTMNALNASTGAVIWSYSTGNEISGAAVANGTVYFGNDDNFYALNAATGKLLWDVDLSGNGYSTPTVADGSVYFGDNEGQIIALNAENGQVRWISGLGAEYGFNGNLAFANGLVYAGGFDDTLYAVSRETGQLVWQFTSGSSIIGGPAVANGVVYFGSEDDNVYALDALGGVLLWSGQTGGPIQSSPAVANGMLYVTSDDNNLYAYALGAGGTARVKPPSLATLRTLVSTSASP